RVELEVERARGRQRRDPERALDVAQPERGRSAGRGAQLGRLRSQRPIRDDRDLLAVPGRILKREPDTAGIPCAAEGSDHVAELQYKGPIHSIPIGLSRLTSVATRRTSVSMGTPPMARARRPTHGRRLSGASTTNQPSSK